MEWVSKCNGIFADLDNCLPAKKFNSKFVNEKIFIESVLRIIHKSSPCTELDRPRGFQEVEAPRFQ